MFEELKKLIVDELKLDAEKINPETNLKRDFGINSIELAELVLGLEDKYDIEIDDKEFSRITTLGEMAEYLEKELA